jgi:hypothetical protein
MVIHPSLISLSNSKFDQSFNQNHHPFPNHFTGPTGANPEERTGQASTTFQVRKQSSP